MRERAKPGTVFQDCPKCPAMVVVAAGFFLMGSPAGEEVLHDDEVFLHRMKIATAFTVGRFEIRGEQYYVRFEAEEGHSAGNACWAYEDGEWVEQAQSGVHAGRQPSGGPRELEGCALPHELGFTEDSEALPAV